MAVATDGDLQFVLVGVTHHGHDVLNGSRPEDSCGHAMKHVALIRGDRTAGLLIEQQLSVEPGNVLERVGLRLRPRHPGAMTRIESDYCGCAGNGGPFGKLAPGQVSTHG